MILREIVTIRKKQFKKTYSNEDYKIRKIETDEIYDEAYDVLDSDYEYEETQIHIGDEIEGE